MTGQVLGFASAALAVPAVTSSLVALEAAGWVSWIPRAFRGLIGWDLGTAARRGDVLPIALLALAGALALPGWIVPAVPPVALAASVGLRSALRRRSVRSVRESLPEALRAVADAMAAGARLERAASAVGRSAAGEALLRFASARDGGADLGSALAILARDDREGTWAEVVSAIELNARCGGDLAAGLRSLSAELDAILDAGREARAATAQARFTANLVTALPLVGAIGVELVGPGSLASLLSNPVSLALAAAACVLQASCLFVVRRIAASVTG